MLRRASLITALMLLMGPLQACPVSKITLGIFEMPPFYGLNADGQATGDLIDLMDQVAEISGCKWTHLFNDSAPRLLENLVDGDADVGMLIRHPAIEKKVIYGSVPVGALRLEAFHLPGKPDIVDLTDLRGQQLIVIRGYGYGGLINQLLDPALGIHLIPAKTHDDAFELLRREQGHYLLDYYQPGTHAINQKGLYHVTSSTIQNKPIYFVLSPRLAKPHALLRELEAALQQITRPPVAGLQ